LELSHILILLATGIFAGFAGGMLGLGGAFVMTPIQVIVYSNMGLPLELALLTAFGTSLLVVLPTSISGAWRHHSRGAVNWRMAVIMGVVSSIVAVGGATLSANLPGDVLRIIFGVILLAAGARMVVGGQPKQTDDRVARPWLWALWALPVGLVSGMFGVGGGVVLIPILVMALRIEIHCAVGTSLAVIILTSIGGVVGYIINGLGVPGRLDYSIGYINLTSFALLAVPAIVMAQVGAVVSHRVPRKPLTWTFFVLLVFLSLRMIGVFEWLGWNI